MEEIRLEIKCEVLNEEELNADEQKAVAAAREARKRAYAPYSGYSVGAAVLLQNDVIVQGNNQENASFPHGLCAERVAIFSAGANYPDITVKCIAIATEGEATTPAAPCGGCRQALVEYEHRYRKPIPLLLVGSGKKVFKFSAVKDLLPFAFDSEYLKKK